ncbi:hypothetical protein EIN_015590 [Entamoeba invadens IP1]|uniref:hypothetical protein n=1 Tax=Entamoeba invadens IP1 TaxID=370355 RepID=UPI0002C3E61E|nr:hypothetical protein EIN_015590 [Entamoeba invadens IP1]ELP90390.1 hypothetical protein EIN_015590 [Entamoeba invadens IP1]|eukprot:XP_004257161.1 hypothetical protein EIN_015590 [Entamoeba invadens IP1]
MTTKPTIQFNDVTTQPVFFVDSLPSSNRVSVETEEEAKVPPQLKRDSPTNYTSEEDATQSLQALNDVTPENVDKLLSEFSKLISVGLDPTLEIPPFSALGLNILYLAVEDVAKFLKDNDDELSTHYYHLLNKMDKSCVIIKYIDFALCSIEGFCGDSDPAYHTTKRVASMAATYIIDYIKEQNYVISSTSTDFIQLILFAILNCKKTPKMCTKLLNQFRKLRDFIEDFPPLVFESDSSQEDYFYW